MVKLSDKRNPTQYLTCEWPAPENVKAYSTTRIGGYSGGAYQGFNLALHVQDDPRLVELNRQQLMRDFKWQQQPFWINQIHATHCQAYPQSLNLTSPVPPDADSSYTCNKNAVCVVMTADCLPILLANRRGTWVAACHAGWRGLLNGVVQNTILSYQGKTSDLIAWIGPAISQAHFEVGSEVRQAFVAQNLHYAQFFQANLNGKYQFDFFAVARALLASYSIKTFGGQWCSFAEEDRFYSYRRDGQTGRMASFIWMT